MKIFNTLSGKKEEFQPQDDVVTMYVCGINPYADSHIGHAMSYIVFDVVRRYLEFRGYKIKHVENITDVEDNIIATANRLGIPVKELTDKYTERYFEDMDNLNVLRADVYPRATGEIHKIIEVVEGLIEKDYAYAVGGNVYFRVRNVPDYGRLSRRSLEQMMAGARIEAGEEKEDPMDFVLWKEAKPDEPSWDSPWGKGRPGWHIECSAMSLRYLGETIDIHGGGQDLVFPHHENEIVQSESFTGKKPFVKYWMHNGLLQMGADKMSKSLGNLITIRDALAKYSPDAIRIFVLSSYYRSPLTYTEAALEAAERGAERLQGATNEKRAKGKIAEYLADWQLEADIKSIRNRFIEAMDDDFNTSQAIAALFDLARDINRAPEYSPFLPLARNLLRELGGILGLTFKEPEAEPLDVEQLEQLFLSLGDRTRAEGLKIDIAASVLDVDSVMGLIISIRKRLREAKKFQLADDIRNELDKLGIMLEDTPQVTTWKRKR